ncbi:MAG: deoxyribose-phosphate aldolase [Candidatus Njordarchaeales archaeon]
MELPQTVEELAKRIDHTNIKPISSRDDILRTINEAIKYGFRGVCIPPIWVPLAKEKLHGKGILIVTIVGFPFGYNATEIKVAEAEWAAKMGANEIDMVMNLSAFKSKEYKVVTRDIEAVVNAVSPKPVKVIIETGYLSSEEIMQAAKIAVDAGASFVKTCTGFGPRGASIEDIKIIRKAIGDRAKVKAAGGIRDAETALMMLKAGADVIGASSSVKILETFSSEVLQKVMKLEL